MSQLRRTSALLALLIASAALLSACGDSSIPGNAVARVKNDSITKDQFNHWADIASISQQSQTTPGATVKATVPVPPDFKACVIAAQAALPKNTPKGQAVPTATQLKAQCQQQYNALRDQVMQFLISAAWIQGEASNQGVKLTDAQAQAAFLKQKKQSFPKEADFQKFLKTSGMNQDDLLFRVRVDQLSTKLRDKITKGGAAPTPAAIKAYYTKNLAQFGTPEKRDIKIVLTKTLPQANAAKKALEAGQSFKAVAKKYSIDQATKSTGGVMAGVTKGQQEASLDAAVFAAPTGKVLGPVKTQFGYYVFSVTKVTPKVQQTLLQATPQITTALKSQGQQKALDAFVKDFQKRWKADTQCRTGYIVAQCKNAPKVKAAAATTAAPTAPPTSAPPATPAAPPTTATTP